MAKLPKEAREFIKLHGYQWKNEILLSMDYDTFMNHSESPNTYYKNGFVLARGSIRKGEEITNDYLSFEASVLRGVFEEEIEPRRAEGSALAKLPQSSYLLVLGRTPWIQPFHR